ncbi:efflux RND transporter permease subunit [Alteromonadaceae bacterium A_SAG4]|uniref:efflux RND transporter permease subunit n=2 Tax=Alteromonas abrolhosensis TaxID=1892904 RepID=UPI00096B7E5B|nr:efflux RND transporter permease subunit [Alteromonas abrolhosensis]NKW88933.1 efflux RND transporter permease subunit [Alteromonadaceae bacterium A_SAG4]NKX18409.1 efflux RND transporter permease subunit [Alteromonadaceae bacterium A_SAG5]NKX33480.1 efflux RND transporter permease subunit [Alteromonadaceae bacterium A_SAG3]NKX68753.1 efflux RND transporter permease subunit [Alteromonadaceae bacterium A_SAG7]
MIESVIRWSVNNRIMVLLSAIMLSIAGVWAVKNTPVDAIPDLSDVQVIVKVNYPGQSPQVVEDQVTFPLTSALMSVPGAQTVRGYSFFGDAYVYIIFDDDTDMYWARSRVLEYLSQASSQLPEGVTPQLGPDATGVGWVYIYALENDASQPNALDAGELRALQDWFLKFELQSVEGVSEVASVGGMVKQYQVIVDPEKLRAYNIQPSMLEIALKRGNRASGASVIEMAEAEYMVSAQSYIQGIDDILALPTGVIKDGVSITINDVAQVVESPLMRRGIAELNGNGETVGGIIVMRYGENAKATIDAVKAKLDSLKASLPEGVNIVPVYDRSTLIDKSVDTLTNKLVEELLVVGLVCAIFLFHIRSSMVALISLPIGILAAFIVMKLQGLNANIMSLGGIAIAIGAMVDGAIVVVENLHKHIHQHAVSSSQGASASQRDSASQGGTGSAQSRTSIPTSAPTSAKLSAAKRWELVIKSTTEVGPALFFALLIITVSFIPVFALEAQEGRLFAPLAFTKTYAMAAAAALAITLVPVLAGYFVRGKIRSEAQNPVNRALERVYQPLLTRLLNYPLLTLAGAFCLLLSMYWPLSQLGSEFMPELDEGDLMYMPTTYPGISVGKARELLQQTDKLIATLPEVETVFGKIGRADTATDPAPLTMIETFIQLKPKAQWREGMTTEKLKEELNALVQFPGLTNAWVMPIKTRIDMLATGIKTPVGIKIAGPDLAGIEAIGKDIEILLKDLPNTASVYAERVVGGRYVYIDIDRQLAARYGMTIDDVHSIVGSAVGGKVVTQSVEGRERFPIAMRFLQHYRDTPESLASMPFVTPSGVHITLGDVATVRIDDGPAGIKSENARLNGWVYIDISSDSATGIDLGGYVDSAKRHLSQNLDLPTGYSITWAGQFAYLERAKAKLSVVIPLTLAIICLLLYLAFKRLRDVALILATLPLALVGSVWLLYLLNFNLSVAVGVGFIALAGVAVEIGVIMLVYLNQYVSEALTSHATENGNTKKDELVKKAIVHAASARLRPVMMTSLSIIVGLLPVLYATGTGSEVMQRIAAPMVGGMASALVLTLLVLPSAFYLIVSRKK